MANIEEKRAHLESALSEISEEEMNQIVGGMDEKIKKHLIEIAGFLVAGTATGATTGGILGYKKGKAKGYVEGENHVANEVNATYDGLNKIWKINHVD